MKYQVAALYVDTAHGPYPALVGPENCWDEARDARLYAGPLPCVAHPPCARWGRYYFGGPQWLKSGKPRKRLGDDGGCFAAAFASVRTFGGVIEHPADSRAWPIFQLPAPPRSGGWIACVFGGWTCYVEQGHYGHRGRKGTWLYYVGELLPRPMTWGRSDKTAMVGGLSRERRRRMQRTGIVQALSRRQRALTPPAFAVVLCQLAAGARREAR